MKIKGNLHTCNNNTAGIKYMSYHAISKTFGNTRQSVVYGNNEACLNFSTMPKMPL